MAVTRKSLVCRILEGDEPARAAADLILNYRIEDMETLVLLVYPMGNPSPEQYDTLADAMALVRHIKKGPT